MKLQNFTNDHRLFTNLKVTFFLHEIKVAIQEIQEVQLFLGG